jgi:VanZ family protein
MVAALLPSPLPRHPEFDRFGPDKLLHLLGHGWHAFVLADALGGGRLEDREAALVAVVVSTGYGVLTGLLQNHVPGRAFERADVVAGFLGSVLAVAGWLRTTDASGRTVDESD